MLIVLISMENEQMSQQNRGIDRLKAKILNDLKDNNKSFEIERLFIIPYGSQLLNLIY